MTNNDTEQLLNNCNSGVIMGIESINHVLSYAKSDALKNTLKQYLNEHEKLLEDIQRKLNYFNEDGKKPSPVAKVMSWISTNIKIATHDPDSEIAEIMHDGCNMGIKSLSKYLNQYTNADNDVIKITKSIIKIEDEFLFELRKFL